MLAADIGGGRLLGLAAGGWWGWLLCVACREHCCRAAAADVSARPLFVVGGKLAAGVGGEQLVALAVGLRLASLFVTTARCCFLGGGAWCRC